MTNNIDVSPQKVGEAMSQEGLLHILGEVRNHMGLLSGIDHLDTKEEVIKEMTEHWDTFPSALQAARVAPALKDYCQTYFPDKPIGVSISLFQDGGCNIPLPNTGFKGFKSLEDMRRWLISQVMKHWSQVMCAQCAEFAKDEEDMSYPDGTAPICHKCMEVNNGSPNG